jgi:hypothetical protein
MQAERNTSVDSNGHRWNVGRLEIGLLFAAIVLGLQFLPPQYLQATWKWFIQILDPRRWSLPVRLFVNVLVVTLLIFYRYVPDWRGSLSRVSSSRKAKKQKIQESDQEKERHQLLEHYKKMHDIENLNKS